MYPLTYLPTYTNAYLPTCCFTYFLTYLLRLIHPKPQTLNSKPYIQNPKPANTQKPKAPNFSTRAALGRLAIPARSSASSRTTSERIRT